jgi:hypothetical protein
MRDVLGSILLYCLLFPIWENKFVGNFPCGNGIIPIWEVIMSNNIKYLRFCDVCKENKECRIWYPYMKGGNVCGGCIKEYVKGLNEGMKVCKEYKDQVECKNKEIKELKLKVNELQDDLSIDDEEITRLKKELESYKDY